MIVPSTFEAVSELATFADAELSRVPGTNDVFTLTRDESVLCYGSLPKIKSHLYELALEDAKA